MAQKNYSVEVRVYKKAKFIVLAGNKKDAKELVRVKMKQHGLNTADIVYHGTTTEIRNITEC